MGGRPTRGASNASANTIPINFFIHKSKCKWSYFLLPAAPSVNDWLAIIFSEGARPMMARRSLFIITQRQPRRLDLCTWCATPLSASLHITSNKKANRMNFAIRHSDALWVGCGFYAVHLFSIELIPFTLKVHYTWRWRSINAVSVRVNCRQVNGPTIIATSPRLSSESHQRPGGDKKIVASLGGTKQVRS